MSDTQHDQTTHDNSTVEMLDVEDEEQRQQRMHGVFMQLDSQLQSKRQQTMAQKLNFDFGNRQTYMVPPPSDLLARVESFLPQFAASTEEITRRAQADPDSVDIEKLSNPGPYIKMNLGLGVYEEKRGSSSSSTGDSDTEMDQSESSATLSSSDSTSSNSQDDDSSDEYDSDSSVDIISSTMSTLKAHRPIRPLPRRSSTRPQIVELGDSSAKDCGSPSSSGDSQC